MKALFFVVVITLIILTGCGESTGPGQSGLTITTPELPEWETGKPGSFTLNAVGGTPPYTWAVTAGALPAGLNLAPTGVISGVHVLAPGTSKSISPPFTVTVTDAAGAAKTIQFTTITVTEAHPQIEILTAVCTAGQPCDAQIAAARRGTPPYTFQQDTLRQGTLPLGIVVGVDGRLAGTANKPGVYTFGVCVKDIVALSDCAQATVEVEERSEIEESTEPEPNQLTPSAVSVKPGPPTCPSSSGGFSLGNLGGFYSGDEYIRVIEPGETFIPPYYVGAWGEEARLFCGYIRDSGERSWGDDETIIYDGVVVQVDYQTSGTFEARPDWARESYCSGKTDMNPSGVHQDIFRSSYVIKATIPMETAFHKNIYSEMKAVADDLISQIEQAPYAIRCP